MTPSSAPHPTCTVRLVLDQIADKWSVLILACLCPGPLRFNAIHRSLDGITHKALAQALRRLERNGIVSRNVTAGSPVAVTYALTGLGVSLKEPFLALHTWIVAHEPAILEAQGRYDERNLEGEAVGPLSGGKPPVRIHPQAAQPGRRA